MGQMGGQDYEGIANVSQVPARARALACSTCERLQHVRLATGVDGCDDTTHA